MAAPCGVRRVRVSTSVHGPCARAGAPGCRGHGVGPCLPSCSPAGSPGAVEDVSFPHRAPLQPFKAVFFSASRKFRVLKNLGRKLLPSEKVVNDPLFSVRLLPGGSSGHALLQGSDYERVEIGFRASDISQKPFPRAAAVAHL